MACGETCQCLQVMVWLKTCHKLQPHKQKTRHGALTSRGGAGVVGADCRAVGGCKVLGIF